jgi:hypothetical protein
MVLNKKVEACIEWGSTILTVYGVYLTSIDYFPFNLWIGLLANFVWLLVGIVWRKWSLISLEALLCAMYAHGIAKALFGF